MSHVSPFVDAAAKSVAAMVDERRKKIHMDTDELLRRIKTYNSCKPEWVDTATMVEEIERLRAGQFRWIPVGEKMPNASEISHHSILVWPLHHKNDWFLGSGNTVAFDHRITHWAPIPPLPERTQEEKDRQAFEAAFKECGESDNIERSYFQSGFYSGLKAARGEK